MRMYEILTAALVGALVGFLVGLRILRSWWLIICVPIALLAILVFMGVSFFGIDTVGDRRSIIASVVWVGPGMLFTMLITGAFGFAAGYGIRRCFRSQPPRNPES